MSRVVEALSEEECELLALLTDPSGIDAAEFAIHDLDTDDGCWRAWDFQYHWFRAEDPLQIDMAGRSLGKSTGVVRRACVVPFVIPGQEMSIIAPQLIHLEALVTQIVYALLNTRLFREMLKPGRSNGIVRRPFAVEFVNGSRLFGRIPQRNGLGLKGCVAADTPVLTSTGYRPARDVNVGDLVCTHRGRWMPVIHKAEDVNTCYEVRGGGSFPLTVSWNHRFYGSENLAGPKAKRDLLSPQWHGVEDLLDNRIYWATPTRIDALPVPALEGQDFDAPEFWWLVGRYLADGFVSRVGKGGNYRRVHWVVNPEKAADIEKAFAALGWHYYRVDRDHSSAPIYDHCSKNLADWVVANFGRLTDGKCLPAWAFGMQESRRRALLDGYLAGDSWFNDERGRWQIGSASKDLSSGLQVLAQTLGYAASGCCAVQPEVTEICGVALKAKPKLSWRVNIIDVDRSRSVRMGDHLVGKVRSVVDVGEQEVVNLIVEEDHSYISGSVVSHNLHPVLLETDEGQDIEDKAYDEMIETLRRAHVNSRWRIHGVTKGVRGKFWEFTKPNSGWTVHQMTAVHRPNWTDQERQEKIAMYGSEHDPSYRRNIMGLHGDAQIALFVLHRLMACVDDEEDSDYNQLVYYEKRITDEMLNDSGLPIEMQVDIPGTHRGFESYWVGMDIGFTRDPSELLVFGQEAETVKGKREQRLRLLLRLHLKRVKAGDQMRLIKHVCNWYQPKVFAMDSNGVGLPIFQLLQEEADRGDSEARRTLSCIKGYNFSEKILVDWDRTKAEETGVEIEDKDVQIMANVKEVSTDRLRDYVDQKKVVLPWDRDLISEFEGQTYSMAISTDQYGRRRFSAGNDHTLDASRMAVLAHSQWFLDEMLRMRAQRTDAPVLDMAVQY